MAGDKLSLDELIEKEILQVGEKYQDTIKEALEAQDKFANSFDEVKKQIKSLSDSYKELNKASNQGELQKGMQNRKRASESLYTTNKAQERMYRQLIDKINEYNAAETKVAKRLAEKRESVKAINRLQREQAKVTAEATDAYTKLTAKYNLAKREAKNMGAQHGENSKQFKEATKRANELREKINQIDEAVGDHQRNVGNYRSALKTTMGTVRKFTSALGVMGGAFMAARVSRDSFKRVREFGSSMRDMAGILGTTREDISGLENSIKEVASESIRTSNEVAELSESLITLGKSKEEVQQLLEPINNLSIALGASSEEAGELVVQTMNAFGASSDEAEHFANVIANARKSTALDFDRIRDAMTYIAPSAEALNLSLEETTAMLGVLVDNGVKASQAGRVMRTAFGRLSKEGKSLESVLENLSKYDFDEDRVSKAVESLNADPEQAKRMEVLGDAAEDLGQRAGPLALVLSQNREKMDDLTQSYEENDEVLEKFVDEQLRSLDSQLKILDSAWEKYLLDTNEAVGASNLLKNAIQFLSDNLKEIIGFLTTAVGAWGAYRGAILAARVQTQLFAAGGVISRIEQMTRSVARLRVGLRALGTVMKRNALGILIAGAGIAYTAYQRLNKTLEDNLETQKEARKDFEKRKRDFDEEKDSLEELTKRYDHLKDRSNLNKDEQSELREVVRKLADEVPNAAKEFDEYGNVMRINTDAVREYNEEQRESLLETSKANKEAAESNINSLEEELEAFKKVQKGESTYVESAKEKPMFGIVPQWSREGGDLYLNGVEATTEETKKFNEAYSDLMDNMRGSEADVRKYADEIKELEKGFDDITEVEEKYGLRLSENDKIWMKSMGTYEDFINKRKEALSDIEGEGDDVTGMDTKTLSELEEYIERMKDSVESTQETIRETRESEGDTWEEEQDKIETYQDNFRESIDLWETLTGETHKYNETTEKSAKKTEDLKDEIDKAKYALEQMNLERGIEIQEDLRDNEDLDLDTRLDAIEKIREKREDLARSETAQAIEELEEIDRDVLQDLEEGKTITLDKLIDLTDEEKKVYQEFMHDMQDIATDMFGQEEEATQGDIENKAEIGRLSQEKEMNKLIEQENKAYQERLGKYKEYANDDERAKELHEAEVERIELEGQIDVLEKEIEFWEKMLDLASEGTKEYEELSAKISEAKKDISEMSISLSEIGEDDTDGDDGADAFIDKVEEIGRKVQIVARELNKMGQAISQMFQGRIQKLEQEKQGIDDYYDNILENEELTDQEQKKLEDERERKTLEIERRIAKEKERQAKFDKANQMAQAIINTAVAVTKVLSEPWLIPIVAAAGATQVAAIAATPIPKYEKGTDSHGGGPALVGEKRPEVILEPRGGAYVQSEPAVMNLPKGSEVIPSIREYNKLKRDELLSGLASDNRAIKDHKSGKEIHKYDKELLKEMRLGRKAFEKQKQPIHFHNKQIDINFEMWRKNNIKWR